jgi:hypothetical protein
LLPKGTPATFALNSPVQGVEADGAKLALALRDAFEESLDLAVYLRQALYERDGK